MGKLFQEFSQASSATASTTPTANNGCCRLQSSLTRAPLDRLDRFHHALIEQPRLVEWHIVRRPLEPAEHLLWSLQRFEVARCQLRVDMVVVAPKEEEQGHFDCLHFIAQVKLQQLRMHGALSEMESFDEPWDLPRRGKAEQHAVQDDGGAVTRLEIYAAVAGRNLLKRVCLVDHFIGRLAELSQLPERARFAATLRLRQVECICTMLLLTEGHDWRHADQGGDHLWMRLGMQETQHRAP